MGANRDERLHPDVEAILALVNAGELATALQLAHEHVGTMEQEHGEQSLYAADALALVARILIARDTHTEAVPFLERALIRRARLAGPTHPLTFRTVFQLAETYLTTGDYRGACAMLEPLSRRVEQRWVATPDPIVGIASCKLLYYRACGHAGAGQPGEAEDLAIECMHRINSNEAWDREELQWLHENVAELLQHVRNALPD